MHVVTQLNDEVYEMYKPSTGLVELELVFFHGLQKEHQKDGFIRSWVITGDSEGTCWLNAWLPQTFPQAHIFSVSYDSCIDSSVDGSIVDMYLLAENLTSSLIDLAKVGQSCPLILVGHCVGGLILKEVCLQIRKQASHLPSQTINPCLNFLQNLRGVFWYSTPHLGSEEAVRQGLGGALLEYLKLHSKEMARVNYEFSQMSRDRTLRAYGVSAARATSQTSSLTPYWLTGTLKDIATRFASRLGWDSSIMVKEPSARYDTDGFCVLPGEDHFSICKPKDLRASSYLLLVEFVRTILEAQELAREMFHQALRMPKVLVKMQGKVDEVILRLQLDKKNPFGVILVGVSGVGKTILAKEVFLRIRAGFDYICFVENHSQKTREISISALIETNLFRGNGDQAGLHGNVPFSVWSVFNRKKVLMVLDDLDTAGDNEVSTLLSPAWCGEGSRLIITSNRRDFIGLDKSSFSVYEVLPLDPAMSRRLFLAYLRSQEALRIPTDLIHKVVDKCDGLPLTIGVVGSFLCNKEEEPTWNATLEKLERAESVSGTSTAYDTLWKKLSICYDSLEETEKLMFLDLSMFDRYDTKLLKHAWESLYSEGLIELSLRNLQNRLLITYDVKVDSGTERRYPSDFDTSYVATMHKQLRDMGRRILRPQNKQVQRCKGVWLLQDVEKLLSYKDRGASTELLKVDNSEENKTGRNDLDWAQFANLEKLRFLQITSTELVGRSKRRFSPELSLFHLSKCAPKLSKTLGFLELKEWPIRTVDVEDLRNLRVLVLDECLAVNLPKNFHQLENLKDLSISSPDMESLPEKFGHLPALESLLLQCPNLQHLPASFLQLSKLKHLELNGCLNLTEWPMLPPNHHPTIESPSSLSNITKLRLVGLPWLRELPEGFGHLDTLMHLDITNCDAMRALPDSFGNLKRLRILRIRGCETLTSLCNTMGTLNSLEILHLASCPDLKRFPASMARLRALHTLWLEDLKIGAVPSGLGALKSLRYLFIHKCRNVRTLPQTMVQLTALRCFEIEFCSQLRNVVAPPQVRRFTVRGCGPIDGVSESLKDMRQLESLRVDVRKGATGTNPILPVDSKYLPVLSGSLRSLSLNCRFLEEPGLHELSKSMAAFRVLQLLEIKRWKIVPASIGNLLSLRELTIVNCDEVTELPSSLGRLSNLVGLGITGCDKLENLPASIANLPLRTLVVTDCAALRDVPVSITKMSTLETLRLDNCPRCPLRSMSIINRT